MGLELDKDGKPYISKNGFGPLSETEFRTGFIEHHDAKGYTIAGCLIDNDSKDAEVATSLREDSLEVQEFINNLAQPFKTAYLDIKEYQEAVKELIDIRGEVNISQLTTKLIRDPETGHIVSIDYNSITNPGIVKGSVNENNFNIITGNFNNIASKIEDDNSFKFPGVSVEGISPTTKLNHKIHGISFDTNQGDRTAQFGSDYKISKVLPIVDKHLDVAPNGYVIKTYDDKKEKDSSWEAELVLEIDSIGSNNSGYGNIDTRIVGYGKTKEEALEDLDKLYLHMLNKFLMINKY